MHVRVLCVNTTSKVNLFMITLVTITSKAIKLVVLGLMYLIILEMNTAHKTWLRCLFTGGFPFIPPIPPFPISFLFSFFVFLIAIQFDKFLQKRLLPVLAVLLNQYVYSNVPHVLA